MRVRLELQPDEAGDVLTVRHLADEIEKVTGIEISNQIIIIQGYRGLISLLNLPSKSMFFTTLHKQ